MEPLVPVGGRNMKTAACRPSCSKHQLSIGRLLVGHWTFDNSANPCAESSRYRPTSTHDGVPITGAVWSADKPLFGTASPPTLANRSTGASGLRISWPANSYGNSLQKTSSLVSGWSDAGLTLTVEGNERVASVLASARAQFFRLVK
jgi:hypothetical protein